MKIQRWLVLTLILTFGAAAAFAALNYVVDPYCIFRCAEDRRIPVFTNERTTKYLFGYSYIPKTFDGVLVGSSISGNWNTARIKGHRVYNMSLSGGNAAEAALILDNVLDRTKLRLALFIVHASMGDGHEPKSGSMNPQEYWGSLGSIPLLQSYGAQLLVRLGMHRSECDAYGVFDITSLLAARDAAVRREREANAAAVPAAPVTPNQNSAPVAVTAAPEVVDEIAFAQYQHLIQRSRSGGAIVVAIVPPQRSANLAPAKYNLFTTRLLNSFTPQDIVIDLNTSEFDSLRGNWDNFWDGLHLTNAAADMVIDAINGRLAARAGF